MLQRYRRSDSLSLLWFSSIRCFFNVSNRISLRSARLSIGHIKEGGFFPEYPVIGTELSLSTPRSQVFQHLIRRVSKHTFSLFSDTASFRWDLLECFINEILPEMDTYTESKLRAQGGQALHYRRRGRCLEFVRASGLKTPRTVWRRSPYPFLLSLRHNFSADHTLKELETYFRMFRLPVRVFRRINRWWLAKKYWVWW